MYRSENEKYRITIEQDTDTADSPRDWDNLGKMICFHHNYNLGDRHSYREPSDFIRNLVLDVPIEKIVQKCKETNVLMQKENEDGELVWFAIEYAHNGEIWAEYEMDESFDESLLDYLDEKDLFELVNNSDMVEMLPLYLYDHSGITMSTSPFSCRWDSGQVGWIYISYEDAKKEYGDIPKEELKQKMIDIMVAEVETYDQYLTGDVYGYIIEEKIGCECCGHVEYETVDSCWGYYGSDFEESGIYGEIRAFLKEETKELINELEWR